MANGTTKKEVERQTTRVNALLNSFDFTMIARQKGISSSRLGQNLPTASMFVSEVSKLLKEAKTLQKPTENISALKNAKNTITKAEKIFRNYEPSFRATRQEQKRFDNREKIIRDAKSAISDHLKDVKRQIKKQKKQRRLKI